MNAALAVTALLMGLAGGPHCVAMCGAACAGIGRLGGSATSSNNCATRSLWIFQAGRAAGYAAMGAVAAASMQAVGWLSVHSAALRPVWTLFHVAAAVLGLALMWQARQPVWVENGARRVWSKVSALARNRGTAAPLALGVCWALLPCGLLYSALLVAGLAGSPAGGALVMALFAAGGGVSLMAGPCLWQRLRGPASGAWAIRLAGAALLSCSGWALWIALVHDAAPWCAAA
ncbi:MAG: sulfite exporter TauE/SafE family protein [Comamonadaceae bacterium]|nr:MAG: sulfite exporter TauE/SafE family protein [Comamonadaceae bacterium]